MVGEHGVWREVADGVLVRRYAELEQALGLVTGTRRCLVIDTGRDEVHGAELAAAVREITTVPWNVVLTHAHFDHAFGTAAFTPCPVWAHARCGAALTGTAEAQRAEWTRHYRHEAKHAFAEALQRARLELPTETFTRGATLDLGGRQVRLLHPGRGHTDHDVVIHVPDSDVVFAGDLVEQSGPPSVGEDSHPADWPSAVDAVLALRPRIVVPGHGDPVGPEFVAAQRAMLARDARDT
ncbi:Glyoxylase, beta-lactamase superfamily II [Haloechinothrix alba]|uniref:Glyoxylase, beta-lactamase superfamily II n=1 Tax=Haloechinothrix alba TaxID=664784 RepID=A0A238XLR6_9PSEU|nr:MBL fold metallo-hydrolase [Haloechinothrix alba]SNR59925.1 Glyoxylase, beta-lactamase superfamily II [Haloechinothrix alba]